MFSYTQHVSCFSFVEYLDNYNKKQQQKWICCTIICEGCFGRLRFQMYSDLMTGDLGKKKLDCGSVQCGAVH